MIATNNRCKMCEVECCECGVPIEIDRSLLNIKGAKFICVDCCHKDDEEDIIGIKLECEEWEQF
jgi:hypothetical protein